MVPHCKIRFALLRCIDYSVAAHTGTDHNASSLNAPSAETLERVDELEREVEVEKEVEMSDCAIEGEGQG